MISSKQSTEIILLNIESIEIMSLSIEIMIVSIESIEIMTLSIESMVFWANSKSQNSFVTTLLLAPGVGYGELVVIHNLGTTTWAQRFKVVNA